MSKPEFKHIKMSMVGDVVLIELITKDIQGPALAQELGAELAHVSAQEWAKRLLLDFHKVAYFSSTGFGVLFRVVAQGNAKQQVIKFCSMAPALELGAEIVGLDKVSEIYETQELALQAFAKA